MNWWTLLLIAVGLAMDAFAVAIATGLMVRQVTPRHVFRLAFHFGLFQFMMPVIGWLLGREVAGYAAGYGQWAALGLLTFVGGKMLFEGIYHEQHETKADPTRGAMLVTLSVATSIDALAVGLSAALWDVSIWIPSIVIGLMAAALTTLGIVFGGRLGPRWQGRAEVIGGGVLLAIAAKILWTQLTA